MRINFVQEIIDLFRHKIPTLKTLVNKKQGYEQKDSKYINTLILGSSHLACGYRAKAGEFNFASPSQDLYYAYNLYRTFNTASVKDIILSFSVFTPGHILIMTRMAKFCVLYKIIFGIEYQDVKIAEKKGLIKLEKRYRKEINRYIKKEMPDLKNYYGNLQTYPKDEFAIKKVREIALKHYKNNQRNNNQMDYLIKLLDDARNCNQKVCIVIPPVTEEYRSFIPSEDVLFSKLYKACEGYNNVKILNFYNSKDFEHSDFCDGNHVKLKGAEKLTNLIREQKS